MDVELASGPGAPGQARQAVDSLRGILGERRHDDLRLILSELVTNAVEHSPGKAISVHIEVDESGTVRGEIADEGDGTITVRSAGLELSGGYGMRIVDRLSREWGVKGDNTRVWFELAE